jgi:hypothetical protein
MPGFHLAQVNIARLLAPLDSPQLAGFVARLDETHAPASWAGVNALADASPGFVWRLQTESGNATALRPYDDDRILVNLSVWQTLGHLREYVYLSAHAQLIGQRREWFAAFEQPFMTLWWVPAGHPPSVLEAKARLEHLQVHGETPEAFTFKRPFPAPTALPQETRA